MGHKHSHSNCLETTHLTWKSKLSPHFTRLNSRHWQGQAPTRGHRRIRLLALPVPRAAFFGLRALPPSLRPAAEHSATGSHRLLLQSASPLSSLLGNRVITLSPTPHKIPRAKNLSHRGDIHRCVVLGLRDLWRPLAYHKQQYVEPVAMLNLGPHLGPAGSECAF